MSRPVKYIVWWLVDAYWLPNRMGTWTHRCWQEIHDKKVHHL